MNKTDSLVCFDLDRTLISSISGKALVATAWHKGMIRFSDLIRAGSLYIQYKIKLRDPLVTISLMSGWLKGKSESELYELCRLTFNEILLPSLYHEAAEEIRIHKSSGRKILILSSTIDNIGKLLSDSMELDGYLCSSMESAGGYLTGRPSGQLCFGDEKLKRLTGYCRVNGLQLQDVWFYSDSISDLPVLSSVGNPVCVNPDRQLKKEALARGWKILHWSN
jgi:HAD superfamily hydrolase (TIGR01490 family)